MTNIYIGFSIPKKFKVGAHILAWWMNKEYDHAYLRFESSSIPSTIYQASHGMVHFREYDNFQSDNKVIKEYKIQVSDELKLEMLIKCIKLAGEPYAYVDLLKIPISEIIHEWFGYVVPFKDTKGYVCSALMGNLITSELGIKFNKPTFLLRPDDIDYGLEHAGYESTEE